MSLENNVLGLRRPAGLSPDCGQWVGDRREHQLQDDIGLPILVRFDCSLFGWMYVYPPNHQRRIASCNDPGVILFSMDACW